MHVKVWRTPVRYGPEVIRGVEDPQALFDELAAKRGEISTVEVRNAHGELYDVAHTIDILTVELFDGERLIMRAGPPQPG